MNILVISYGTRNPSAALIKEFTLQGVKFESEYYRHKSWSRVFPEYAISELLREHHMEINDIDRVAFCGKPFPCLERLIHTHIFFFPRYFFRFISDFKDYFTKKFRIPTLIKKELGIEKPICYPDPMHAIADGMRERKNLIISLHDTINFRTIGLYKTENDRQILVKELLHPHCLSLLNLANTKTSLEGEEIMAKLSKPNHLVKIFEDGSFYLKSKSFQYENGAISLKPALISDNLTVVFENILSEMIKSFGSDQNDAVTFISDYPINGETLKRLKYKFKNLEILILDSTDVMEYTAKYTATIFKENNA